VALLSGRCEQVTLTSREACARSVRLRVACGRLLCWGAECEIEGRLWPAALRGRGV